MTLFVLSFSFPLTSVISDTLDNMLFNGLKYCKCEKICLLNAKCHYFLQESWVSHGMWTYGNCETELLDFVMFPTQMDWWNIITFIMCNIKTYSWKNLAETFTCSPEMFTTHLRPWSISFGWHTTENRQCASTKAVDLIISGDFHICTKNHP